MTDTPLRQPSYGIVTFACAPRQIQTKAPLDRDDSVWHPQRLIGVLLLLLVFVLHSNTLEDHSFF